MRPRYLLCLHTAYTNQIQSMIHTNYCTEVSVVGIPRLVDNMQEEASLSATRLCKVP